MKLLDMQKIRKKLTYLVVPLLFFSANSLALSLDEYITKLIENHPHFAKNEVNETLKSLDKDLKDAGNTGFVFQNSLKLDDEQVDFDLSITKKFTNGSDISILHGWREALQSNNINLVYSVPIVRNVGGINDSLSFDLATVNIAIETLKSIESNEQFIANQMKKLLELSFLIQSKEIQEKQLELTSNRLDLANNKYEKGLIDTYEVLDISEQKLSQEKQFIQTTYELDLLKTELAKQINIPKDDFHIDSISDLQITNKIVYLDISSILPNLRAIQQINLEKDKLSRQLESVKNQALPYVVGRVGNNLTSTDDKYLDSFSDMKGDWYFQLDAMYNLGGKTSELDLANIENAIKLLELNKQEQEMNIINAITGFEDRIEYLDKMQGISANQKDIAKDKLIKEQDKYNNALNQKEFVILAEQSLYNIELANIQDALNYQKMVIDYLAFIDELI